MKKIWIPLILACLALTCLAACGNPPQHVEGFAYESLGNGTCKLISKGGNNAYTLTVPDRSPQGERVVAIGAGVFRGAENLTRLTLPEGLEIIEENAFRDCASLQSVTFPSTLREIGDGAFWGCADLFYVRLPKGLEKLGNGVFAYCSTITNLSMEEGGEFFEGSSNCIIRKADKTVVAGGKRTVLIGGVEHIAPNAFRGMPLSETFTVPVGVVSIGEGAFFGVSTMKSIHLPASLTSIGEGAFGDNAALVSYTVSPSNTVYRSEGNAILTMDGKTLLFGCNATVIPEGVEKIGAGAFRAMKRLSAITLPASIREIGSEAFCDCPFLETFTVNQTEDTFETVEKGKDWKANSNFTVVYVAPAVE